MSLASSTSGAHARLADGKGFSRSLTDPLLHEPAPDLIWSRKTMSALANESERINDDVHARVPWYVIVAWSIFTVAYVTYRLIHLAPNLGGWFAAAG